MTAITGAGSPGLNATAANWNKEAGAGLLDRLMAKIGIGGAPKLSVSPKAADLKEAAMKSFEARLGQTGMKGAKGDLDTARSAMSLFLDKHLGADKLQNMSSSEVRSQMRSVDKAMSGFTAAIASLNDMGASSRAAGVDRSRTDRIVQDGLMSLSVGLLKADQADARDVRGAMNDRQIGTMTRLHDAERGAEHRAMIRDGKADAEVRAVIREDVKQARAASAEAARNARAMQAAAKPESTPAPAPTPASPPAVTTSATPPSSTVPKTQPDRVSPDDQPSPWTDGW